MAEKEILLTAEGLKKMEEELENLKTVRRKEVAERIRQAIAFGDISENSEYDDAKNEQAFIEGSIIDLEKKLRNVTIIDESDNKKKDKSVRVGSTVKIHNVTMDKEFEYTIVGSVEADPANNRISNESPVGKAILGAKVGESIDVEVPAGTITLEILAIK